MLKSSFSPNKAKVFLYTLQLTFLLIHCIEIFIFLVSTFFSLLWYALSPRSIFHLHVQEHSHFSYPWNSLFFFFCSSFFLSCLIKLKMEVLAAIPLLGICPKELKSGFQKAVYTLMFIETLFTRARILKQLKQQMNRYRKYGIYTQWNITQP